MFSRKVRKLHVFLSEHIHICIYSEQTFLFNLWKIKEYLQKHAMHRHHFHNGMLLYIKNLQRKIAVAPSTYSVHQELWMYTEYFLCSRKLFYFVYFIYFLQWSIVQYLLSSSTSEKCMRESTIHDSNRTRLIGCSEVLVLVRKDTRFTALALGVQYWRC